MISKRQEKTSQFFSGFDDEFCRYYLIQEEKDAYLNLKKTVDMMMVNTFIFNDNWDMEPCLTPYRLEPMQWDKEVNGDKEWNYMLNRHTYLLKFMTVYLVEQNPHYLDKVKVLMFHWIDHNQLKADSLVSRTLDTGMRCFTWLKLLLYLEHFEALTEAEYQKIVASMKEQLQFLWDNYVDKYSLSNWGVLQTTAMLACLDYFADDVTIAGLQSFAESELKEQLRLQILDDGSQYEQSVMYHVEVFRSLMDLAIFCPQYRPILEEKLQEMALYIYMMTGPDHCQVALGDSDITDTRDMMTLATIFFQSGMYKEAAFDKVDCDNVMLFGKAGISHFEEIKALAMDYQAKHFKSSGHICLKDSRRYLFFKCGPFGSAHSHSDQNALCLYDKGKPIVIDPGRYTYKEDPQRYFLKSAKSHSTCTLSDIKTEDIRDSWTYESYPSAVMSDLQEKGPFQLIEGVYQVEASNGKTFEHRRLILCLPNAITLIFDHVIAKGDHCLETQFVLDKDLVCSVDKLNDLKLVSEVPFKLEQMRISQRYNQLHHTNVLKKTVPFTDEGYDYTLFLDEQLEVTRLPLIQTGSVKTLASGFGFDIKGPNTHYLLGILPQAIIQGDKLYQIGNQKFRGRVVVYDVIADKHYCLKS